MANEKSIQDAIGKTIEEINDRTTTNNRVTSNINDSLEIAIAGARNSVFFAQSNLLNAKNNNELSSRKTKLDKDQTSLTALLSKKIAALTQDLKQTETAISLQAGNDADDIQSKPWGLDWATSYVKSNFGGSKELKVLEVKKAKIIATQAALTTELTQLALQNEQYYTLAKDHVGILEEKEQRRKAEPPFSKDQHKLLESSVSKIKEHAAEINRINVSNSTELMNFDVALLIQLLNSFKTIDAIYKPLDNERRLNSITVSNVQYPAVTEWYISLEKSRRDLIDLCQKMINRIGENLANPENFSIDKAQIALKNIDALVSGIATILLDEKNKSMYIASASSAAAKAKEGYAQSCLHQLQKDIQEFDSLFNPDETKISTAAIFKIDPKKAQLAFIKMTELKTAIDSLEDNIENVPEIKQIAQSLYCQVKEVNEKIQAQALAHEQEAARIAAEEVKRIEEEKRMAEEAQRAEEQRRIAEESNRVEQEKLSREAEAATRLEAEKLMRETEATKQVDEEYDRIMATEKELDAQFAALAKESTDLAIENAKAMILARIETDITHAHGLDKNAETHVLALEQRSIDIEKLIEETNQTLYKNFQELAERDSINLQDQHNIYQKLQELPELLQGKLHEALTAALTQEIAATAPVESDALSPAITSPSLAEKSISQDTYANTDVTNVGFDAERANAEYAAKSQPVLDNIIVEIRSVLQELGDAYNELREAILNNADAPIESSNNNIKYLINEISEYERHYASLFNENSREEKINELHQLLQDNYNAAAKERLKEIYCEQLFELANASHTYADLQSEDNQLEINRINKVINQQIENYRTAAKDSRSIDDIKIELDQFAQSALEAVKIAQDRVSIVQLAPQTDTDESHPAAIEVATPIAEIAGTAINYEPVSDVSKLLNETLNNLDRVVALSSKKVDASKNAYEKKKAEFEEANSKLKGLEATRDSLAAAMVELESEKANKFSPNNEYIESQREQFVVRYVKIEQQQIENSTALDEITPQTIKLKEEMVFLEKKWLIDSKVNEIYISFQELLNASDAGILEYNKVSKKISSDLEMLQAHITTDPLADYAKQQLTGAEQLFKQCEDIAKKFHNTVDQHVPNPAAEIATSSSAINHEPVVESPAPSAAISTANSLTSAATVTSVPAPAPAPAPVSIITPTARMQNDNAITRAPSDLARANVESWTNELRTTINSSAPILEPELNDATHKISLIKRALTKDPILLNNENIHSNITAILPQSVEAINSQNITLISQELDNVASMLTDKMKQQLFDNLRRQRSDHTQMLNTAANRREKIGKNAVNVLQEFIKKITDAIDDSTGIMNSQDKTNLRAIRNEILAALDTYLDSTKSSTPKIIKHTIIRTARKIHSELTGGDKKDLSRDELKALSKQYKAENPKTAVAPQNKTHNATHGSHRKST